jgi:hypothetical protein
LPGDGGGAAGSSAWSAQESSISPSLDTGFPSCNAGLKRKVLMVASADSLAETLVVRNTFGFDGWPSIPTLSPRVTVPF